MVTVVGLFMLEAFAQETGQTHRIPFFPSASDDFRSGFARVINHSVEAGEVSIDAIDDEGESYGPVVLSIDVGETVHLNSGDVENGNAEKDLSGATGSGEGDWRLQLASDLDIEVLSYIRTGDGFLTAMHDTVPSEDGKYRVAFFNPGSNNSQVSRLHLINPGEESAVVSIVGVDDQGESPGSEVKTTIPAGASRTFTAAVLESGEEGIEGALGDGTGKWRLTVESVQPIVAMSLLSSPTNHLTNLSTSPAREAGTIHSVPFFPSAPDAFRTGLARVVNHSAEAGEVRIDAIDDEGESYGPIVLSIGAGATAHLTSDDLENGNAEKDLSGATSSGEGDWRLQLTSDLDIEVLSYIRTGDGFLTAMHDTVPSEDGKHRVAFFNPGSNSSQVSRLRLINPGEEAVEVSIVGVDDRGESPGSEVTTTILAGASRTYTAADLESGGEGLEGALGDGRGKWQLEIASEQPIIVMSLLKSPTGHLTNLSSASFRRVRPTTTAGVCGRTPEIRDKLVALAGRVDCADVTDDDLAGVAAMDTGRLSALRSDDLRGLSNLWWLTLCTDEHSSYLPRGTLSTLPEGLFAHTPRLRNLQISGCSISELPAQLFSGVTLSYLRITEPLTRLPTWPKFIADSSYNAQITLGITRLTRLPAGAFANTGVKDLWIQTNEDLGDVSPGAFRGLPSLERLALSWSSIQTLPVDVFSDLPELRWLQVVGNKLQTLPDGLLLPRGLEYLSFNGNPLTGLPENLFAGLSQLRDLRIETYHEATPFSLPPNVFRNLRALETLQLSYNGILELTPGIFDGLHNLKSIRLANNRIETLPPGMFDGLTALESIDLRDNPGAPFTVRLDLERLDARAAARGPARIRVGTDAGFPMSGVVRVSVINGASTTNSIEFVRGTSASDELEISQDSASGATHVGLGPLSASSVSSLEGIEFGIGEPLVLFAESGNRMPLAHRPVSHRKLQVGGADWTYLMGNCFSDVDGDRLTYTGRTADAGVARVTRAAGDLVISPVSEGKTTVTVTASDPGGLEISQSFDVVVEPPPDRSSFHIDLDFVGITTDRQRRIVQEAADRWMSIITGDIPEVPVIASSDCTDDFHDFTGLIDDLRVRVRVSVAVFGYSATATVHGIREESSLPFSSGITLGSTVRRDDADFRHTVLHELAHALGFTTEVWEKLGYLQNPSRVLGAGADTHFNGPLAIQSFDDAGGAGFTARSKVPLSNHGVGNSDSHWEFRELMDVAGIGPLSAITVQLFADLGYDVDVGQADEYRLPRAFTGTVPSLIGNTAGMRMVGGSLPRVDPSEDAHLDLSGDVLRVPVEVVNRRGERTRIIQPGDWFP